MNNDIYERIVSGSEPLDTCSISELVSVYNMAVVEMDRDKDKITTFRDKPTAIRRVQGVLVELRSLRSIPDENRQKLSGNASPGLRRLRSSEKAEALRLQVLADQEKAAELAARRPSDPTPPVQDPPPVVPPQRGGRTPVAEDDMRIHLLVQGNPKRGSSARRFDCYTEGMTVRGYMDELASRGLATPDKARGLAHRDVNWDAKQKYIRLSRRG